MWVGSWALGVTSGVRLPPTSVAYGDGLFCRLSQFAFVLERVKAAAAGKASGGASLQP
jgi:hypothetical protein